MNLRNVFKRFEKSSSNVDFSNNNNQTGQNSGPGNQQ